MSEEFDRILGFAAAERQARNSPQWGSDLQAALDRHSEAVDVLFSSLYAALDDRANAGKAVVPANRHFDAIAVAKKLILTELRQVLPKIIRDSIDEITPRHVRAPVDAP